MKNITCKDCKYFVYAVDGRGFCHVAPPVPVLDVDGTVESLRPEVSETDRCCKEQAWDADREQK